MAITTQFFCSTDAINSDTLIPVNQILTMDKNVITNPNDATQNRFQIIFVVNQMNAAPREIILKYADQSTLDDAFDEIKSEISTDVTI